MPPAAANPTETIDLVKQALSQPNEELRKSITTATGLVAYDLQAPSKNLYPVNTPLRNMIPRVAGGIGTATNWKVISAIAGSGYDAMGWVKEGQRSARMSYTQADKAASYRTIGEEDQVTYEATSAALGFEDVRATMAMRLLQKAMLKEENAILGGNASLSLGTPTTPTTAASGSGATLPTLTYDVIVVALTYEGYRGASLAGGVPTTQVITGADGLTYTLNGGSSNKSATATQAITLGQVLSVSTPVVAGAVAYAWYIGASGAAKLEAITTINSATFSAPLAGTGQAISAITADNSKNASLAFDGLLTFALNSANGGYLKALATGTAGTGTVLTASGRGSCSEIDTALQAMWDANQVSPEVLFVNSQELKNITNKVLTNASGPLVQFFADPEKGIRSIAGGGGIEFYFNPFATNGGYKIPIKIHPTLPPGTILGFTPTLPVQFQSNGVPNVVEMKTRRDYYQIDWPIVTRQYQTGVYAEEVLAVYAPFALMALTNIANG